jgi:protein-S-isoprenylcysteine O-methyltransferase Ste14
MSSVQKRTYLSVIGTIAYIWAFLFIPAWSIYFWQAWIFWSIFSILVIIISVYFLKTNPTFMESRLHVGPLAEKEKSQKIIQFFSSIFFLLVLIIPGFDFRYHWSSIPVSLVLFADFCIVIGFWIVFLVFKENTFASAIIQIGKNQKVIQSGPYQYIRHPMYAGAALLVGAMPIALGSYWAFLFVIFMGIGLVFRIIYEEKLLLQQLSGYKKYYTRVRYRLIPFVW